MGLDNKKAMGLIRGVIGAYLIYLAYSLVAAALATKGMEQFFFIVGVLLFAIVGIWQVIIVLLDFKNGKYK